MFKNYKKSFLLSFLPSFLPSFLLSLVFLFIVGCSDKEAVKEYDKPALYWYKNIIKSVSSLSFDKADNYYISLRSEHMRSPLLSTATMILAQAHMEDKSYLMSDYYLDEYLKKYASSGKIEQARFLKIKAAFLGVKNINRDQKLMIDTLSAVDAFIIAYPNSYYRPIVDTLKVRLQMAQYLLNESVARLYSRIGKDEAAKVYRGKNEHSVLNSSDIEAPKEGFFAKIFN